jgi:dihydrofolate reductase
LQGHPISTFCGDVTKLFPQLVLAAGDKHVWIVGGGDIVAQFVSGGLVDELIVSYAPCTLSAGAKLLPTQSEWTLGESAPNRDFLCARWCRNSDGS